jgi:hypothetical protein
VIVHTLENMNLRFPEREIFLRLGGHVSKTGIPEPQLREFRKTALAAFELCRPCGRWMAVPARRSDRGIELTDGTVIPGADFAARCEGITMLWCGAVTVGNAVVAARDNCPELAASAIYDAVASECADAAMDHLQQQAAMVLRRQGSFLAARRYSPGYGDMPLSVQRFFYERLNLPELDMQLNEQNFFLPEKSVTAFAGIIQEINL